MFLPVSISVGAGGEHQAGYSRIIETSAKFDALSKQAENMTEPFTAIAGDLHAQIAAAFATQGDTGASGKWRALSPQYAAWKRKHAPAAPILVGVRPLNPPRKAGAKRAPQRYGVSGKMMRELLVPISDRSAWHVGAKRLLYAPMSDIAGFHQMGTPKMPARPPVDVNLTFLHAIDRHFLLWLNGLMENAGLSGTGSGPRNPYKR